MLARLVTAGGTLALLVCGATIALEALGLLFHVRALDADQRAEAFLAEIEASVDPRDVPDEAEDVLGRLDTERREAAQPGRDEERTAVGPERRIGPAGQEGQRAAAAPESEAEGGSAAGIAPQAGAAAKAPLPVGPAPALVAAKAAAPALATARPAQGCTGRCVASSIARVAPRAAVARRTSLARASRGSDCPVLEWMNALVTPPRLSSATRASTSRRTI